LRSGGELHSGRYFRFNPQSEQFTEYVLPEPYGIDREKLDRQFHRSGHRLVRRPRRLDHADRAARLAARTHKSSG